MACSVLTVFSERVVRECHTRREKTSRDPICKEMNR